MIGATLGTLISHKPVYTTCICIDIEYTNTYASLAVSKNGCMPIGTLGFKSPRDMNRENYPMMGTEKQMKNLSIIYGKPRL